MKVTLNESKGTVTVEREDGDKRVAVYRGWDGRGGVDPSSTFLFHVKKNLNRQGYDFVKKPMWKDGHMVDEIQQYLRERKPVNGRCLAIFDGSWAIRNAVDEYNESGSVTLRADDLGKAI